MKRLEQITNVALIVACVAVTANVIVRQISPRRGPPATPPYQAGERIPDKPTLRLAEAERTVMLVTNSYCHFCTESMPFYRSLLQASKENGARVLAITTEDRERNRAYLESNGLGVSAILVGNEHDIKLRATPMIVITRRDGIVMGCWLGKLDATREREVLAAVAKS